MTFRTIDTDLEAVGATTETELTTGVARRARSARRAAIWDAAFAVPGRGITQITKETTRDGPLHNKI